MKHSLSLSLSLSALALIIASGSTMAADLPTHKAAPQIITPPPVWTGFYVGLNAGGAWASNSTTNQAYGLTNPTIAGYGSNSSWAAAISAAPYRSGNNYAGFMGGGQVGYNWQVKDRFLLGGEADIQGIASNSGGTQIYGTASDSSNVTYSTFGKQTANLNYLGTVRGRIGYLVTPALLVYGTGGVAYGQTTTNASYSTGDSRGRSGWGSLSFSNTQVGWTAGGGVEWMFMQNWSAKAEYLYYNLGSVGSQTNVVEPNGAWSYNIQNRTQFNGNLVRAGVNYHINWGAAPILAKY